MVLAQPIAVQIGAQRGKRFKRESPINWRRRAGTSYLRRCAGTRRRRGPLSWDPRRTAAATQSRPGRRACTLRARKTRAHP